MCTQSGTHDGDDAKRTDTLAVLGHAPVVQEEAI